MPRQLEYLVQDYTTPMGDNKSNPYYMKSDDENKDDSAIQPTTTEEQEGIITLLLESSMQIGSSYRLL